MLDPHVLKEASEAKIAREYKDLLIETQSAAYNYATSYAAVIVFGAYAALFTIWTQARAALSEETASLVGLLMGISIVAFVAFEVFKMVMISRNLVQTRNLLVKNYTPAEVIQKRADLVKSQNLWTIRVAIPVWIIALTVSALSGFAAAFILMGAFVRNLAS